MAAPMNSGVIVVTPINADALGWTAGSETANGWGNYRGYRGYRGYRRHHDRIDGGDILAGILVIGGIAAIASAASRNDRDRRYEERDYPRQDPRYDDRRVDSRDDSRYDDSRYDRGTDAMESAINVCSDAAERQAGRDARVSSVQSVIRDGEGWRVEGELSNSSERTFLCGASDGRVEFVQIGDRDVAFSN